VSGPVRTCLGCGAAVPQGALVRLRVEDGGHVVTDGRRRGGRGAWVHAREACVQRALQPRALARAFRRRDLRWDGDALRRELTGDGSRV
jgi:predicted RNA-binding protein YlxR (DUF448 family)